MLYAFKGGGDGAIPVGNLIDVGGALYGTTDSGGQKRGTVWSLNLTTDAEMVLHAFDGADGKFPETGLLNRSQTLFGTTDEGGCSSSCAERGCGMLFSIRP